MSPTADTARRPDNLWVLALFFGALLLRLVHVATVSDSPLFNHLFIDPGMYDEWGLRIASGQLASDAPFFLDPLYPYFVGLVYALFGQSYLAVAVLQAILGSLVAPLILLASRRWFDAPVARTAGVIAALYPVGIYYSGVLLKPGLAMVCVTLALWLLSRALDDGRLADWFGGGVALGLATLLRGNLLFVVPLLALYVLFARPQRRQDRAADDQTRGSRWPAPAALLAGSLLAVLPATVHNYAVAGELILTTTNVGQIFYIGNNEANPNGRFYELPYVRSNPVFEQIDFKNEAERRTGHELRHREVSRYWLGQGFDWIRSDPSGWLALSWSKLRVYWGGYETPASQDYYLYRRAAPLLRLPLPTFGLLGPLGLLGALFAWRRAGWPRLLVVWVAGCSLAVVAFFVLTRFRMVAVPALYVTAALALVELCRRGRAALVERRWFALGWPLGALVVFFIFVNLPVQATADTWSFRVASALGIPTRLETTSNAHFNLGVTYAAEAKRADDPQPLLDKAEAELRQAIAEESRLKYHVELGKVLARLQRNEEAISAYKAAAAIEPGDYRIHHALGLLHRRTGNQAAAESGFREALRLNPRFVAGAVQLGELMLDAGRTADAARAFRYALQLRPGDEAARRGLARAGAAPAP